MSLRQPTRDAGNPDKHSETPCPFLQQSYRFSAGNAKAQINMVFTGESFYHSFPAYGTRHQVILYLFRSRFNDSSCYFPENPPP
ncbi:hypothetical protein FAP59_04370 [Morganella morganii]|nr:hypothetical protein [Morganella morganii]